MRTAGAGRHDAGPRGQGPQGIAPGARQRAEAVALSLAEVLAGFEAAPPDHPAAVHADFARLYLAVTRCWLAHLAQEAEPGFALRVIPLFFDLYRLHVLARIGTPLAAIAPHWRLYHRLAQRPVRSPALRLLAVCAGVRAHTHHDLGMAIRGAEAASGARLHQAQPQRLMFDAGASQAFAGAVQQAFAGSALAPALSATQPLWLPVLHRWRLTGYRRALAGGEVLFAGPGAV